MIGISNHKALQSTELEKTFFNSNIELGRQYTAVAGSDTPEYKINLNHLDLGEAFLWQIFAIVWKQFQS